MPVANWYNLAGAPALPVCEADIVTFVTDLQAWIVRNFSQLYAAMAVKATQSHDVCTQLELLVAPDCLIDQSGIDQTTFRYAATADEVILPGSGVLPYIPGLEPQYYSAGAVIVPTGEEIVQAITPIDDALGVNFGVYLTAGSANHITLLSLDTARKNSGDDDSIGITAVIESGAPDSAWVNWLVFPFT